MATVRKRTWTREVDSEDGKGKVTITNSAWLADYFDSGGSRRQKTFRTKKTAEDWLVDVQHDIKRGVHTPDGSSITVADAGERWIRRGEIEGLERSTICQRDQHMRCHINPLIGGMKLSQLTAPIVQDFADNLLETRSHAMARKTLTSLKSLISEAQRRGFVAQNVAREIKIRAKDRHMESVVIPTKPEIKAMLAGVEGRWRPFLVTATFTGMRASELRGLPWADVSFDAEEIRVSQRADRWGMIGSPKSKAGRRSIPMSPMVCNTLREWKLASPCTNQRSEPGIGATVGKPLTDLLGVSSAARYAGMNSSTAANSRIRTLRPCRRT